MPLEGFNMDWFYVSNVMVQTVDFVLIFYGYGYLQGSFSLSLVAGP